MIPTTIIFVVNSGLDTLVTSIHKVRLPPKPLTSILELWATDEGMKYRRMRFRGRR